MSILSGIAKFILKILLQGLWSSEMTKVEEEGKQQAQAGKAYADSVEESSAVEVDIAKAHGQMTKEKDKPKDVVDPFGVNDWNRGE